MDEQVVIDFQPDFDWQGEEGCLCASSNVGVGFIIEGGMELAAGTLIHGSCARQELE